MGGSLYRIVSIGPDRAVVNRPKDGWVCVAHGPALYMVDEDHVELQWDYSTQGHFLSDYIAAKSGSRNGPVRAVCREWPPGTDDGRPNKKPRHEAGRKEVAMEQDRKYVHVVSALRETIKKNGVPREIYIDRETVCQFESEENRTKIVRTY